MLYVLIAFVLVAIAIFVDIQRYLADPQLSEKRAEWFARFAEYNRSRQRDPELAWRYMVIDQAFDRHSNR